MKAVWLTIGALLMMWFIWKFVSGLIQIEPTDSDPENRSRSDGTWWS